MKLTEFIEVAFNGNISEFARSKGVLPSQAQRWIKRDCVILNDGDGGSVYCKVTKQVKANESKQPTTTKD